MNFNDVYSKKLYLCLKSWQSFGIRVVTLDDLRKN